MEENRRMLVAKERQRQIDAEAEMKLIQAMRQKFQRDIELEKEQQRQLHEKKLQYRREILRQKEENSQLYERERLQELSVMQREIEEEEYRQQVVKEARKRLLQEHARKLEGYLHPDILHKLNE